MAYSDGEIMKTVKSLKRKSPEEPKQCDSFPALKHQLDLLESDLSFIMKFTGICLTHYTRKLVKQNETKTVQKYRLSENCQSVPFQLEFQMVEQNQNNKNISTVTGLSIIIESEGYSDLSKFISRVEESGNLLLFFKSLSCFSEWCGHQKRTLAHFKKLSIQKQPGGNLS
uniref:Centromere protein P n=1 Tax=Salvator merianae TaxID=96440 RepID=A0A8D0E293_SALMN